MAFEACSTTFDALKSITPPAGRVNLIADGDYAIDRGGIITDLPILEPMCIRFFDALATVPCGYFRLRDLPNSVLRKERRDGDRIVPVDCIVILLSQRTNLLFNFWVGRVFLFGKSRQNKAERETC